MLEEIEAAFSGLSARELRKLAVGVVRLFREKKGSHPYEDSHGTLADTALILSVDQVFQEYDRAENWAGAAALAGP